MIMSMKNTDDTIGNRTRDLSACSAVSEPTAPPATCSRKIDIRMDSSRIWLRSDGDGTHPLLQPTSTSLRIFILIDVPASERSVFGTVAVE
jgi:hypothetical protein